jgi:hypothetical protein
VDHFESGREYCSGFLFEPAQPAFVFGEFRWQDFRGDFEFVLLCVFSQEDFSHPTLAQPFENAIMRNCEWDVVRPVVVISAGHAWEFPARSLPWRFKTSESGRIVSSCPDSNYETMVCTTNFERPFWFRLICMFL